MGDETSAEMGGKRDRWMELDAVKGVCDEYG